MFVPRDFNVMENWKRPKSGCTLHLTGKSTFDGVQTLQRIFISEVVGRCDGGWCDGGWCDGGWCDGGWCGWLLSWRIRFVDSGRRRIAIELRRPSRLTVRWSLTNFWTECFLLAGTVSTIEKAFADAAASAQ